jgi:hypothetical protein
MTRCSKLSPPRPGPSHRLDDYSHGLASVLQIDQTHAPELMHMTGLRG